MWLLLDRLEVYLGEKSGIKWHKIVKKWHKIVQKCYKCNKSGTELYKSGSKWLYGNIVFITVRVTY